MNEKALMWAMLIAAVVLGSTIGFWFRGLIPSKPVDPIVQTDTLYLRDTIKVDRPVPRIVRIVDTMLVPVIDTVHTRDSIFISIPREEKVYEDSTYRAVVSGYKPSLDSISVYRTTKYITITKEKPAKRWHIGPQVGIGFVGNKDDAFHFGYYVGVGVQYSIISF